MTHRWPIRVYYEDTDLAGVVYYANYLRFIERARSEMLRAAGVDQQRIKEKTGLVFAVRRIEADYLAPARFDDALVVETELAAPVSAARIHLEQRVARNANVLFRAQVTIVCLGANGRPARIPAEIGASFG